MGEDQHLPPEHDPVDGTYSEEYELVDIKDIKRGVPGWVVALVALLSAAVGAGVMLMSGYSRADLVAVAPEDASPVASSICAGSANVRSGPELTSDVVDTMNFGDDVTGMLQGAWVKLDEGRYISVSVLCDLAPVASGDQATGTAGPDDAEHTAAPQESAEPTPPEDIPGTLALEGQGNQTVDLPVDARSGLLTFEHPADGSFALSGIGVDGSPTASPALSVVGDQSGTVVFGLGTSVEQIKVTTDGPWTLRVAPLDTAAEMTEGAAAAGTATFLLGEDPGTWTFEPTAPMNLVQYSPDGTTASAEVNGVSEVELMGGGTYLVVYTGGPWTAYPGAAR